MKLNPSLNIPAMFSFIRGLLFDSTYLAYSSIIFYLFDIK